MIQPTISALRGGGGIRGGAALLAVLLAGFLAIQAASAQEKRVMGWVEKVRIDPEGLVLAAKLDSGAEHCSLHAARVTQFTRGGQTWVRFEVPNDHGERRILERKRVRMAKIKRHHGGSQKRPVVRMGLCIGDVYKVTEVNLVDRAGFKYRLLIGRKFMEEAVIIDPARMFTVEPACKESPSLE